MTGSRHTGRIQLRLIALLAVSVLALIFIAQNTDVVEVRFLFWQLALSRALMYAVILLIGVAGGWLLRGHRRR